ncbi:hypothetical protein Tco_1562569 [Tanacetum coccineum]
MLESFIKRQLQELHNKTLSLKGVTVEAARIMLIFSKSPLFIWAKAVAPRAWYDLLSKFLLSRKFVKASRPDLVFVVCMCARYQAKPTEKHLTAVKRVFRYLKRTINMVMWYPKDIGFELTAFADADHVGCQDSRKSTSGSAQFLEEKLVSWSSKKQKYYGFDFNEILFYCDSKSSIALPCNTIQHSRMNHIAVRYHFIKEQVENEVGELHFVKTAYQLADIFTKALERERFKFILNRLDMQSITP